MLATHHIGATLHGAGGATVRIDAQVPRGYRIVLRDPRRFLDGGLAFEIVRGSGRDGVLRFRADAGNTRSTPVDPAHPSPGASAREVALANTGVGRARRVTGDRYLLLRGSHPTGLVIALTGPLHATLLGIGWGRAVLDDLARSLTARWLAPVPVAGASAAAGLALRDMVDAAVVARDGYTVETHDSTGVLLSSSDVIRSVAYQATYSDDARTSPSLVRIGPVLYHLEDARCWRASSSRPYGPVRAPLLPVAALGLTYSAPATSAAVTRLRYRYWDTSMRHVTVAVDIDPATHLPLRRATDIPYDDSYAWIWRPVARLPTPRPRC